MKDCFGAILVSGDQIIVVAPSAPMRQNFMHMGAEVVKRRGRKVGIRFPDSDYIKYNKYVLPDSIMKMSTWLRMREEKTSTNPSLCQACRNPGRGFVCLCL
jgi:hypothetical protein